MRAVVIREFGDEDVLRVEQVRDPSPGRGEALVRVGAVEVSRTRDVATRSGHHPFSRQVTLPHVLGGDFAGTVEAVGPDADPGLVGRRVVATNTQSCGECAECLAGNEPRCANLTMLGIHRQGSYAELAVVSTEVIHPIPDDLPMGAAAAMAADGPIAFAQLAVGAVGAGTWLLVTGATGALGTTLVALGVERGAKVVGVSRRPEAIPAELELQARLDAHDPDLTDRLYGLSEAGIEVVADNVGDPTTFSSYFEALAVGARILVSGAIGAPELPILPVPAAPLYVRSISILGMRTATRRHAAAFWDLVASGFRMPAGLVHEMPLGEVAAAHARIAAGTQLGHTVLTV
jgi:D-arabinose 1-dehydrogenase-like Zn-dependent alcohol dehydrogenase